MDYIWLCLSALAAGGVNAIAGGGTLLTFPTLVGVLAGRFPDLAASYANATSTVATFPGSLAGVWGYRQQIRACRRWIFWLTPPSFLGGALGACLVQEETFRLAIPWLILTAAILFLLQPMIARLLKRQAATLNEPTRKTMIVIAGVQLIIGVYGGYFGAGIGILMLTSLSFLGLKDIHHANALKTFLAFSMNAVGASVFIVRNMVVWQYALPMALAAIAGGYLGARLSLRLPPFIVRWIVIVIAFGLAA